MQIQNMRFMNENPTKMFRAMNLYQEMQSTNDADREEIWIYFRELKYPCFDMSDRSYVHKFSHKVVVSRLCVKFWPSMKVMWNLSEETVEL